MTLGPRTSAAGEPARLWIDGQSQEKATYVVFRGRFRLDADMDVEIRTIGANWYRWSCTEAGRLRPGAAKMRPWSSTPWPGKPTASYHNSSIGRLPLRNLWGGVPTGISAHAHDVTLDVFELRSAWRCPSKYR